MVPRFLPSLVERPADLRCLRSHPVRETGRFGCPWLGPMYYLFCPDRKRVRVMQPMHQRSPGDGWRECCRLRCRVPTSFTPLFTPPSAPPRKAQIHYFWLLAHRNMEGVGPPTSTTECRAIAGTRCGGWGRAGTRFALGTTCPRGWVWWRLRDGASVRRGGKDNAEKCVL